MGTQIKNREHPQYNKMFPAGGGGVNKVVRGRPSAFPAGTSVYSSSSSMENKSFFHRVSYGRPLQRNLCLVSLLLQLCKTKEIRVLPPGLTKLFFTPALPLFSTQGSTTSTSLRSNDRIRINDNGQSLQNKS